jgi:hypothetical protein
MCCRKSYPQRLSFNLKIVDHAAINTGFVSDDKQQSRNRRAASLAACRPFWAHRGTHRLIPIKNPPASPSWMENGATGYPNLS